MTTQSFDPSSAQSFGAVQAPPQSSFQVPTSFQPTSAAQSFGAVQTPPQFSNQVPSAQAFGQSNIQLPSNFNHPVQINVDGPASPLIQPTDAVGSVQADTVAHKLQKLIQLHDTTRDIYRSCIINKDVTDKLVAAYVGRAQSIANQIKADPSVTPAKKTELTGSLNICAKSMVEQVNSNFGALVKSKYGQSLTQNTNDVLKIDPTKVILNYLTGIEAKMNEQTAVCNNLNANFYAKAFNDYTNNLNKVVSVFKQLSPSAGNSQMPVVGNGQQVNLQ